MSIISTKNNIILYLLTATSNVAKKKKCILKWLKMTKIIEHYIKTNPLIRT